MVNVDSGEFKLLRHVDINHQPSREKVVSEWIWAFDNSVPVAIENIADVIEDVFQYPIIWQERRKAGPIDFLESIGIIGLDLDKPAKLLKDLRNPKSKARIDLEKKMAERAKQCELAYKNPEGKTNAELANDWNCSERTVIRRRNEWGDRNCVRTQNLSPQEPRKVTKYSITHYTKPTTAAQKIRATFGDDFANQLAEALTHEI